MPGPNKPLADQVSYTSYIYQFFILKISLGFKLPLNIFQVVSSLYLLCHEVVQLNYRR